MKFNEAMAQYEKYLKDILGRSENTIVNYMYDIEQFSNSVGNDDLNVSCEKAERYFASLAEKGLSASTRSRKITALQMFYNFLIEKELVSENPINNIRKPKLPQKQAKIMSAEEIHKIIETAKNEKEGVDYFRNLTLISLLFSTGLRRNELINIRLEDVDLHDNSLFVREGKGNKQRTVYYNDEAKALLSEYIKSHRKLLKYAENSEYLFCSNCNEKLGLSTVNMIVNNLYEKAGLKDKHYGVHGTRRAFATSVYNATHDIFAVQNLLGHSNPQTTMRYVGVSEESKKNVAQAMKL